MKKMNNKGFSLVELIVVIAIMVVLVAVLAPVFTKYVEQSRRSTDVTNAQSIAESVLADVADGAKDSSGNDLIQDGQDTEVVAGTPTAILSDPTAKANAYSGNKFQFRYDLATNRVKVHDVGSDYDLTQIDEAEAYKTDDTTVTGTYAK